MIANFNSKKDWENYCYNSSIRYLKHLHFRKWVNSRKIHIINFSNLGNDELRCIQKGLKEAIGFTGTSFKIIQITDKKEYKKFFESCVHKKELKGEMLLRAAVSERKSKKRECADIFISNYPIDLNGTLIKDGEALTFVSKGVVILTFDEKIKYPKSFLMRRAKHEGLHLFGLNMHHESTKVKGHRQDISCIMRYNAPTKDLCPKCSAAIQSFWRGIKDGRIR